MGDGQRGALLEEFFFNAFGLAEKGVKGPSIIVQGMPGIGEIDGLLVSTDGLKIVSIKAGSRDRGKVKSIKHLTRMLEHLKSDVDAVLVANEKPDQDLTAVVRGLSADDVSNLPVLALTPELNELEWKLPEGIDKELVKLFATETVYAAAGKALQKHTTDV